MADCLGRLASRQWDAFPKPWGEDDMAIQAAIEVQAPGRVPDVAVEITELDFLGDVIVGRELAAGFVVARCFDEP
jgi:hypothetical protein